MSDRISVQKRSENMAAIKSRNTGIEQYICHELFSRGYRYRKNVTGIPGHPDLFLKKSNPAIFVNGCFWHRHEGCKYAYTPKTRTDFWKRKFEANIKRDRDVIKELEAREIKCITIWECTIKKMKKDVKFKDEIINEIEAFFRTQSLFMEL